jgi:hypothetical protein
MIMEGRKIDSGSLSSPRLRREDRSAFVGSAQAKIKMTQLGFQEDELDMVRSALTTRRA